jgi:FixJ family two-component response regulator
MTSSERTVFVVDDESSVREAICSLLRSVGIDAVDVPSAQAFLEHERRREAACLVLDVRMPGLSGLDLQRELFSEGSPPPIVFITGHGDIPMAVRAMKAGAVEFLPKPFREHDLLDAVASALRADERTRATREATRAARERHESLTDREKEVLGPIVEGKLNKQVGAALGVSEQTVKVHRHHIMRKMGATSLPDLVRMVEMLRGGSG